jgi:crossover junction endodeoxyribonuclease RuvC
MRVLGVDPGLAATGYGLVEYCSGRISVIEGGVIRSSEGDPLVTRVGEIFTGMTDLLREFRPDVLSMEELYSHYKHPRTAIIMGHARGAVLVAAHQEKVPVCHYAATMVKMALTGNGRANKGQVRQTILAALNLQGPMEPLDTYDALAVAMCHINHTLKAAMV